MNIGPRGLNGTAQRMRELQSRIDSLTVRKQDQRPQEVLPNPRPFNEFLSGEIKPVNPMSASFLTNIDRAPASLRAAISGAATSAGIDPALFEALVGRESSFRPDAVSQVGAVGLAQLMPKTAESLGVTDAFDPVQNLNAGARYLAQLVRQNRGDMELALAAYNAGPGTVKQVGGIPEESKDYVRDVLARSAAIRQAMQSEGRP